DRCYAMALEADPHDPWALWFRSQNRRWQHKFDAALKDADALVAIPPAEINRQGYFDRWGNRHDFHVMAFENRAKIYGEMRQPDRAEQDLDAAVAYGRTYLSVGSRGKFLAYRQGREGEAFSDLIEAIALGSVDEEVFYAIGLMQVKRRQFNEALNSFDRAFEIAPRFADALRMRARMHRALDQTEPAVSDMMQAVTLSERVLHESMPALRAAGYWSSGEMPDATDPALADAIRACMLDEHCNGGAPCLLGLGFAPLSPPCCSRRCSPGRASAPIAWGPPARFAPLAGSAAMQAHPSERNAIS